MHFHTAAALAASISFVSAQRGFNTGSLDLAGNAKQESNFLAEFRNQRLLEGTDGAFTSARLYTVSPYSRFLSLPIIIDFIRAHTSGSRLITLL